MSTRNKELQTVCTAPKNNVAGLTLGGQVPSNMTRWVTFLMIDSATILDASDVNIHFASVNVSNPSEASTIAATNRKINPEWIASNLSLCNCGGLPYMLPESGPNPDSPLFSIAGGNWLSVFTSVAATVNLFMQYFDE